MEKDFKFLDIENISEEELIHIGGTLIFKLGEVENFGELMSLYFQEGFLPFVKTPEELYSIIWDTIILTPIFGIALPIGTSSEMLSKTP